MHMEQIKCAKIICITLSLAGLIAACSKKDATKSLAKENSGKTEKIELLNTGKNDHVSLDLCLSLDPEVAVNAVNAAAEANEYHILELAWIFGNVSGARVKALEYLTEPETIDVEIYKEKLQNISRQIEVRYKELEKVRQQNKK